MNCFLQFCEPPYQIIQHEKRLGRTSGLLPVVYKQLMMRSKKATLIFPPLPSFPEQAITSYVTPRLLCWEEEHLRITRDGKFGTKKYYNIASVLSFGFFWPQGMWDLSSPTRDQIGNAKAGRQSPNHWTTREVPAWRFADSLSYLILTTTAR